MQMQRISEFLETTPGKFALIPAASVPTEVFLLALRNRLVVYNPHAIARTFMQTLEAPFDIDIAGALFGYAVPLQARIRRASFATKGISETVVLEMVYPYLFHPFRKSMKQSKR